MVKLSPFLIIIVTTLYLFSQKRSGESKTKIGPEKPTISDAQNPSPSPTVIYPSQVLNLTNWKITLPIGSPEHPTEIAQPKLSTYSLDPWFTIMSEQNAVRFRAAVKGVTTDGSKYPRSELREMVSSGREKAKWSSKEGVHILFLDQAITAVPKNKQDVVAGQIHDNNKDIIVIRLDYPNLHIRVDGKNVHTLDPRYTLGKRFTIKFMVSDGRTEVYYNNSVAPVYTHTGNYSNAYFKAGVYTQSNCEKESSLSLCNENNYGEVVIYQIIVTHK